MNIFNASWRSPTRRLPENAIDHRIAYRSPTSPPAYSSRAGASQLDTALARVPHVINIQDLRSWIRSHSRDLRSWIRSHSRIVKLTRKARGSNDFIGQKVFYVMVFLVGSRYFASKPSCSISTHGPARVSQ